MGVSVCLVSPCPQKPDTLFSSHLPWQLCTESPKKFENQNIYGDLMVSRVSPGMPEEVLPGATRMGVHGAD